MTQSQADGGKICRKCGVSCDGKPRVKDKKGRYLCRSCFDSIKAARQGAGAGTGASGSARAAAAAPSESDAATPDWLFDVGDEGAQTDVPRCPSCGTIMEAGAVVCVHCGHGAGSVAPAHDPSSPNFDPAAARRRKNRSAREKQVLVYAGVSGPILLVSFVLYVAVQSMYEGAPFHGEPAMAAGFYIAATASLFLMTFACIWFVGNVAFGGLDDPIPMAALKTLFLISVTSVAGVVPVVGLILSLVLYAVLLSRLFNFSCMQSLCVFLLSLITFGAAFGVLMWQFGLFEAITAQPAP